MLLGMHIGDDEKAGMVAHYAKTAAAAGHDPDRAGHVSAALVYVADDARRARRELRAAMTGWLTTGLAGYTSIDGRPRPARDPAAYAALLCTLHPVGSADECVDRLRTSAERTGIRHVILMVEGAGTPESTLDNIARLGAEVLPHLR